MSTARRYAHAALATRPLAARLTAFACSAVASSAFATTSTVFGPSVEPGERALEYRATYAPEEESFGHRLHYQHAFTDDVRGRLIAAQRRRDDQSLELAYWRWETQWQYLDGAPGRWDAAVRGEVQVAEGDDGAHRLRLGWTASRNVSPRWQQRINVLAGREIGGGRAPGVALELRAQTTIGLSDASRLGVELFSDLNTTADIGSFDDQDHQLGPVFKQKLGRDWSVTTGVLAGVSDAAADLTWRVIVERGW